MEAVELALVITEGPGAIAAAPWTTPKTILKDYYLSLSFLSPSAIVCV